MNELFAPTEGGGRQPEGARPQEGCTPMVPPTVTAAAQLDNMLLLVVGGSDIQALARQLLDALGGSALQFAPTSGATSSRGHAAATMPPMGLPSELSTPQAMRLWHIAQEQGWVDEHLKPKVAMSRAAILASVIADELGLTPRWKPFELWWNMPNLANRLTRAQYTHSYSVVVDEYVKCLTNKG